MKQSKFPKGWDEEKIQELIHHYEEQSDEDAIAEYEKAFFSESRILRGNYRKASPSYRKARKINKTKIKHH
ncbi:MAG: hypothetical protein AAB116_26895 [Candidatus Poribacteria bacterium]